MGFITLFGPRKQATNLHPTTITVEKPRIRNGVVVSKENLNPATSKNKSNHGDNNGGKKKSFWSLPRRKQGAAPKLSVFLEQEEASTANTASMSASLSHNSGSRTTLSSKSMLSNESRQRSVEDHQQQLFEQKQLLEKLSKQHLQRHQKFKFEKQQHLKPHTNQNITSPALASWQAGDSHMASSEAPFRPRQSLVSFSASPRPLSGSSQGENIKSSNPTARPIRQKQRPIDADHVLASAASAKTQVQVDLAPDTLQLKRESQTSSKGHRGSNLLSDFLFDEISEQSGGSAEASRTKNEKIRNRGRSKSPYTHPTAELDVMRTKDRKSTPSSTSKNSSRSKSAAPPVSPKANQVRHNRSKSSPRPSSPPTSTQTRKERTRSSLLCPRRKSPHQRNKQQMQAKDSRSPEKRRSLQEKMQDYNSHRAKKFVSSPSPRDQNSIPLAGERSRTPGRRSSLTRTQKGTEPADDSPVSSPSRTSSEGHTETSDSPYSTPERNPLEGGETSSPRTSAVIYPLELVSKSLESKFAPAGPLKKKGTPDHALLASHPRTAQIPDLVLGVSTESSYIEDSVCAVHDDLSIENLSISDSANEEDLTSDDDLSFSVGSKTNGNDEVVIYRFVNLKSFITEVEEMREREAKMKAEKVPEDDESSVSSLSSVNSIAKEQLDDDSVVRRKMSDRNIPYRISTAKGQKGDKQEEEPFVRGNAQLSDIIGKVERKMSSLQSMIAENEKYRNILERQNQSNWIPNAALQGENSSYASSNSKSLNSEEFNEGDFLEDPIEKTTIANFAITPILEEEHEDGSEDDPFVAAMKRGARASENDEWFEEDGIPVGVVDSLSTLTFILDDSGHSIKSSRRGSSTSPPRTGRKCVSWTVEPEVFEYPAPKCFNLSLAIDLVRTYDPKYSGIAKQTEESAPKPISGYKTLPSILRTKGTSPDLPALVASDDGSASYESFSSMQSSDSSVQYMVQKLQQEAERRRKKLTSRRASNDSSTCAGFSLEAASFGGSWGL